MACCGKRLKNICGKVENKNYSILEAINFLKENSSCKFDETLELTIGLNLDPKKSDQSIRGMVSLPAGTGKTVRVAVFAKGSHADEALAAGADVVGADDLAEKVKGGEIDFDVCIASPDMMGTVGKIGKILGPKGLMPNPKLGTVTQNIAAAVKAAKSGQAEYKLDSGAIVHAGVGKLSFNSEDLVANVKAFINAVVKAKPATVKGSYVKRIGISSTMGVGLKVDLTELSSL